MTKIDRILTENEYNRLIEASRKSNYEQLTDMIEFAYITAPKVAGSSPAERAIIEMYLI